METNRDGEHHNLLTQMLLPAVGTKDAYTITPMFAPYILEQVPALHITEKAEDVSDKISVGQSEEQSVEVFNGPQEIFLNITKHRVYSKDIVEAIFETTKKLEENTLRYQPHRGEASASRSAE